VLGADVGGIRDLVVDGVNGLLVPPGDTAAIADALVRMLSNRELAERLAAGARSSAQAWLQTPDDYARSVRRLVERVTTA
jgi:glycosyltransferase involved in cell wall biosynthesis